jgi:glycosyltransferase involved in cell wall biosynthesis
MSQSSQHNQPLVCIVSCVGGLAQIPIQLWLDELASEGYRVATILAEDHGPSFVQTDQHAITHITLASPGLFWPNGGFKNTLRAIFQRSRNSVRLARYLTQIKPAVCICSEPDAWLVAILLKRRVGFGVIAYLREVFDDRLPAFPHIMQGVMRRLLHWTLTWLSIHTDEIVHVSRERQGLFSYLRRPGVVIGHYPVLQKFPDRQNVQRHDTKLAGSVVAVHAGALRPTYGSDLLIEAMRLAHEELPALRFVVLGGVSGKLRSADLIEELVKDDCLELRPQVAHTVAVQQLFDSDIGIMFVSPDSLTTRYAQPLKLYEYLAAGLPVVASDVPTVRRVVDEWNCGLLVDSGSPQNIATAILRLATNPSLREELGRNARRAAEMQFNWENEAPKVKRVLSSVLSGEGA